MRVEEPLVSEGARRMTPEVWVERRIEECGLRRELDSRERDAWRMAPAGSGTDCSLVALQFSLAVP